MKKERAERKKRRAEKKQEEEEQAKQDAERKRQEIERKKRQAKGKRQEAKRKRKERRREERRREQEGERRKEEIERKRQEAEEERQEKERKKQEAKRKQEVERKRQEEERKRQEAKRKQEVKRKRQEEERKRQEAERKKEAERKREDERKKQEEKRKKQEAKMKRRSEKPIKCHLCPKGFKTPAAYAQHLESCSKKHSKVNRGHVTQAVRMLDVIPLITLAPSINSEYQPSTPGRTESIASSSGIGPFTSEPSLTRTDLGGSWIPLGDEESIAGPVVLASSVSPAISRIADSPLPPHAFFPVEGPTTYTPSDFTNLGIPYACSICLKTFRTVVRLTQHMNSPVHNPDAFKCPKPECGRQFALVSGLIQHLESGTCKLASAGEIFERFALLTARFSKYLAA